MKLKQETLLRHILEAIEVGTLATKKVNLYKMDTETSRGVDQLREAGFIEGAFHEIVNGPILIEGMPWLTLKGQEYLEKLRWRFWRTFLSWIGVGSAVLIAVSNIISGLYYLHQLWPFFP